MLQEITTCLWFDTQAKEAVLFYQEVFGAVEISSDNPYVVNYKLYGRPFMHLNGGPRFKMNSSISFLINGENEAAVKTIWDKLIVDGNIMMPLNKYPWSSLYGWCADKFGVNWQIMLGHESSCTVMPQLLFCGPNNGKANEAIEFYTAVIKPSHIVHISKYEKGEPDIEGNIKYSQFELNKLPFGTLDSSAPHDFNFNEGVSFMLTVDTQEEIDYYWDQLSKEGTPGRCGWLKDKFGVSWQVVPSVLGKLMTSRETAANVTKAFMGMSKFIIADLALAAKQ